MLDKMLGAFKAKIKPAQEEQKPMDEGQPESRDPAKLAELADKVVSPAKLAEWADKVVAYVYDEELAQEIAPCSSSKKAANAAKFLPRPYWW